MRGLGAYVFLLLLCSPLTVARSEESEHARKILQHGPWPMPWSADPSNRVSGNPEAVTLGRRLFFDARLSPTGRVSCSSCHRPERGWSDGRRRGIGISVGKRNTPGLTDVRLNRWLGWTGAGDSLWAQTLRPLLDPAEMGASAEHVQRYFGSHAELADAYSTVFGRSAAATAAEDVLVDAAKALAAYQEKIVSGRTAFDDYRDALATGNHTAQSLYPPAALRGLMLFVGQAGCSACHSGPAFTDSAFHATGPSRTDRGRADGIERLLASPYTLAGRHNDDPKRASHWRVEDVQRERATTGAFRTPTLRQLALTAPYLHDGSRARLAAVLRSHPQDGPLLSQRDRAALLAFLRTLSAPSR